MNVGSKANLRVVILFIVNLLSFVIYRIQWMLELTHCLIVSFFTSFLLAICPAFPVPVGCFSAKKKSDRVKPVLITVNDVCRLGWSFSICHEVSWLQWTLSSLQWMLRYWQVKWKSRLLIIVNIPSDAARFRLQPTEFLSFFYWLQWMFYWLQWIPSHP